MEISIIIEIYDRNNTTQIEDTLYLVLQTIPSENTEKFETKYPQMTTTVKNGHGNPKLKFSAANKPCHTHLTSLVLSRMASGVA